MAVIRIPKTPAKAFNKDRPVSELLKGQIEHLEWAIRPAAERSPSKVKKIKLYAPRTEGEAAARIEELTRQLHPDGVAGLPPASPAAALAAPAASRPEARKKAAQARTRAMRKGKKTTLKKERVVLSRQAGRAAKGVTRRGRRK